MDQCHCHQVIIRLDKNRLLSLLPVCLAQIQVRIIFNTQKYRVFYISVFIILCFSYTVSLGSSKGSSSQQNTGLAALQNMAMIGSGTSGMDNTSHGGGGSSSSNSGRHSSSQSNSLGSGMSSRDSFNALFAQTSHADAQAFIKQHQKLIQQLPPNSAQRKTYEALLTEMKQAAELR